MKKSLCTLSVILLGVGFYLYIVGSLKSANNVTMTGVCLQLFWATWRSKSIISRWREVGLEPRPPLDSMIWGAATLVCIGFGMIFTNFTGSFFALIWFGGFAILFGCVYGYCTQKWIREEGFRISSHEVADIG